MPHNIATVVGLLVVSSAMADVFVYECDRRPIEAGWKLVQRYCNPDRWLDRGLYFQHVRPGCGGPPNGDQESFSRSLKEYEGEEEFFIEWVVATDGDRSEIPGTAPASLVAGSRGLVNYHFTIAQDQVRFIRDNRLPILYIDIEPRVAHTYRLELYRDELYVWFIDGEVVDSGSPEGPYPSSNPSLNWRAKSWYLESTTKWDYIRYGTIPDEGSGDFDSDEDVDLRDYYYVHECLSNSGPGVDAGPGCRFADFDDDKDVDLKDLADFQTRFTGEDG